MNLAPRSFTPVGLGCGLAIVASSGVFAIPWIIVPGHHAVSSMAWHPEALGGPRSLPVLQKHVLPLAQEAELSDARAIKRLVVPFRQFL